MSGKSHQKTISKVFPISNALIIEMFIPIILGMAAVIAHARFRMHIGIPGHQGLVFMALLLVARKTSKLKWSSIFFSIGVGSMLFMPFLGFNDPFILFVYLWPGILFDLFYVPNSNKQSKIWFNAIVGGIAYSSIPISRLILGLITGIVHKSLVQGLIFPFLTFFLFGLLGTLIGLGLYSLVKKFFR